MSIDKLVPARSAAPVDVSSSDWTAPKDETRLLLIGSAGSLHVLMEDGEVPVTIPAIPAGQMLPISVKTVFNTGTTAGNITAFW